MIIDAILKAVYGTSHYRVRSTSGLCPAGQFEKFYEAMQKKEIPPHLAAHE
jgi:hypothetical protein